MKRSIAPCVLVAGIQFFDASYQHLLDLIVARNPGGCGIGKVGQENELQRFIRVG
jgi:hypothetical protein